MLGTQSIMSPEIPSSPIGEDYGRMPLGLPSHLTTRGEGGGREREVCDCGRCWREGEGGITEGGERGGGGEVCYRGRGV